jgi:hypothetical protein
MPIPARFGNSNPDFYDSIDSRLKESIWNFDKVRHFAGNPKWKRRIQALPKFGA